MSDVPANQEVALIFPENLESHYAQVVPMQAAQANLWRRSYNGSKWRERASYAVIAAQAVAIFMIAGSYKVITTFVYLDKFGMPNTDAHLISELPVDHRLAGIDAILWNYTRLREHYVASTADDDYHIVSAMSADKVREQYQQWANPKFNPKNAPAVQVGQHGYIKLFRENGGSAWIAHNEDYTKGVYQITFCRLIVADGKPATAEKMVETMNYTTLADVPLWVRMDFNYAGAFITAYPGPETVGTGVKLVSNIGSDNPCDR